MNNEMQNKEALSALADGQLSGEAFAGTAQQLLGDAQLRATWHSYQLIGDVLRSSELAHCQDDAGFLARFRTRLESEPQRPASPMASASWPMKAGDNTHSVAVGGYPEKATDQLGVNTRTAAANAPWKWLALAASVVAVGAVGWNLLGLDVSGSDSTQLAQSSAAGAVQLAVTGSTEPVMLRDARLDELLAAHKQLGGTSALQMPAGFLRNATFDVGAAASGR